VTVSGAPLARGLPYVLLGLLTAARLAFGGSFGLAEDEAYYAVWSERLAAGYLDHPPAIAWLIRGGLSLLGPTEQGVRLLPLLLGGLTAAVASRLSPERGLLIALFSTMPLFALGGMLATPDVPLLAAWALGLFAAERGAWPAVGLAAGLAMLSKYTGLLLLPLLVLAEPAALRRRGPYIAALIALLVYLPNAVWNVSNDLVSWRFQWAHVGAGTDRLGLFAAQLGLGGPLLFPALLAWAAVGWRGDNLERRCWWASVPVLLLAVASGGEANWAAPFYVGGLIGLSRRAGRWSRAAWMGLGVNGLLSGVVVLHVLHPIARPPVEPRAWLDRGQNLGDSVAAWGASAVYTSRYQEAALIDFYGGEALGGVRPRPLPGLGRPTQYDLWEPEAAEQLAPSALFVRPERQSEEIATDRLGYSHGDAHRVSAYIDGIDPLHPLAIAQFQVYEVRR
jgi:4-amino-4-deoxy-L-arabinose transferase-like glycosyltransferase